MIFKKLVKYFLPSLLSISLMCYIFQEISFEELIDISRHVRLRWIFLAIVAHLINHGLRAFRWCMLLQGQGIGITYTSAWLAEMGGFFVNLIPPRMGEWTRCFVLKRLEHVPISKTLGSIIIERFIDAMVFLLLSQIAFFIEYQGEVKILPDVMHQLSTLFVWKPGHRVIFFLIGMTLFIVVAMVYMRHLFVGSLLQVTNFLKELWLAIRSTESLGRPTLWVVTLFIWWFHFMVEYFSFFSIEETSHLSIKAAFYIFISMCIGMFIPTPGGMGSYHITVTAILSALGVEWKYAVVYATVTHAVQLFNALVIGGICLLIATYIRPNGVSVQRLGKDQL